VQHNFELEKEILGLGDGIVVLSPDHLRSNITERLSNALELYNTSITDKGIATLNNKFVRNGFCTVNQLYSRRTINQLNLALVKNNDESRAIDLSIEKNVKSILITPSVEKVLKLIAGGDFSLKNIKYYKNIPDKFCEFYQSGSSKVIELLILLSQCKTKTFAIDVIPGSHKKQHSKEATDYIVQNCNPVNCHINTGGAIILNSALIKCFPLWLKEEQMRFLVISAFF
jgi:ectoine hydroxylase-related dioxygenase (phytanoyl-CoA dioxygenase family)